MNTICFDRNQVTGQLQNQCYAWSKKHNIVFVETNTVDGIRLQFGRPADLTVFLLTWDERLARPRVIA